ncbi:MAG: YbjN domain-containing protein [Novosphingobium sp.]
MKILLRQTVILLGAIGLLSAAPTSAKNVTADVDQIAAVMKADGKQAEIKTAKSERYVSAVAAGYTYAILPFGCDDAGKNCKSVQFFIAFNPDASPTLEAMNTYARENRWGRIYLDKDGDPALEFDVDLEQGGMSQALFLDNVAYWEAILAAYAKWVFGKE